jgi:hypothetical protein
LQSIIERLDGRDAMLELLSIALLILWVAISLAFVAACGRWMET